MAIQLHTFVFNGFGVNNYILEAENGDCIIVDAACSNASEQSQLKNFFADKKAVRLKKCRFHGVGLLKFLN